MLKLSLKVNVENHLMDHGNLRHLIRCCYSSNNNKNLTIKKGQIALLLHFFKGSKCCNSGKLQLGSLVIKPS